MSRKVAAKTAATGKSQIEERKRELEREAAEYKRELEKRREFLQKVPEIRAKVQQRESRVIMERYERPTRLGGPVDFRAELGSNVAAKPHKRLRKERSKAPYVTLLLVIGFCIVLVYAWRVLWQG